MPEFDHDAAMQRGAERQRYTEGLVSELYDLAEINAEQTPGRGGDMWLVEFAIGLLAKLDKFGNQHRPLLFGSKERETQAQVGGGERILTGSVARSSCSLKYSFYLEGSIRVSSPFIPNRLSLLRFWYKDRSWLEIWGGLN